MSSIGERLQHTRETQGMTLQEVSHAINIKEEYLSAVESNEFDCIPGVVFVKGFIRTYGNYLGLDGTALVEEYKREYVHKTPQPEVRSAVKENGYLYRRSPPTAVPVYASALPLWPVSSYSFSSLSGFFGKG